MGDSVTVDDRAGGMQVNGFSRKRARHPNGCQVEKRQRYERAEKGYSSNPGSSKSSREKAQVREAYFGQVGRQLDGLLRYSAQECENHQIDQMDQPLCQQNDYMRNLIGAVHRRRVDVLFLEVMHSRQVMR
eukprot:TRINITY_DN22881_c0_g1_i2.p1 TRINITY_DN22881_c0_g1~~TRINITY_DN22881_c0_g1_i2.p1  ORF type:complete len:154 (+),score=16.38 TRINITY_DN22881_c0_g1_i2:71-463(+)